MVEGSGSAGDRAAVYEACCKRVEALLFAGIHQASCWNRVRGAEFQSLGYYKGLRFWVQGIQGIQDLWQGVSQACDEAFGSKDLGLRVLGFWGLGFSEVGFRAGLLGVLCGFKKVVEGVWCSR